MAQVTAGILLVREAWEEGKNLFREDHERAKSDEENMEYFSMIDFAVDCYTEVSSSRIYRDNSGFRDWAINVYMVAWREHFLKDQEREDL